MGKPLRELVLGVIRLYVESREDIPESQRPAVTVPVIDCHPHEAAALKRRLQRRGYVVHAVPI